MTLTEYIQSHTGTYRCTQLDGTEDRWYQGADFLQSFPGLADQPIQSTFWTSDECVLWTVLDAPNDVVIDHIGPHEAES